MKTILSIIFLLLVFTNMSSQSLKDKIAQRKAMVEKAKKDNLSGKLNPKDIKKLEELLSLIHI